MLLYDNAYPSKYEEIKTWYPVWYRDVFEMDALWRIWGKHLDDIQAGIIQAIDNNFIDYADAQTITKLETWLGIVYDGPRTLSERKNVVKAFFLGSGHIGQEQIKNLISVFTAGEITVRLVGSAIVVSVTREFGEQFNLYDCHLVLDNRIPAHLALNLTDNILPMSFYNHERFIFIDLNVKFGVKEHTIRGDGALLDGEYNLDGTWLLDSSYKTVVLIDFAVHDRFKNYGVQKSSALLNGQKELDGSWLLDTVTIFGGMRTNALAMSRYVFKNTFGASASVQYALSAENKEDYRLKSLKISGAYARQQYNLTGRVAMDGRWKLDGVYTLDGSRQLQSIYETEDL